MPQNVLSHLPYDSIPPVRLEPLFNIGIYDIASLSAAATRNTESADYGPSWVACTTDDVLASKPQLYDVLVKLPPAHAANASTRIFPKMYHSDPSLAVSSPRAKDFKATQRDARRYQTLRYNLNTPPFSEQSHESASSTAGEGDDDSSDADSTFSTSSVVESTSWSLMAYTSLVWWASAGEKRSGPSEEEDAEMQQDQDLLLADLPHANGTMDMEHEADQETSKELAIVAYFQRLTGLIVGVLSHAIERQEQRSSTSNGSLGRSSSVDLNISIQDSTERVDGSDEEPLIDSHTPNDDGPVEITSEDMTQMGLDTWSNADRIFVEEMLQVWWGRRAIVRGGRIECCGLRIL